MIHSHITGRLTRNSELKKVGDNDLLQFALATDHGFGDKKVTLFIECKLWGKRANSLANYLTKGSQVVVHGELSWRDYDKKDGTKGFQVECRVSELDLVGGKKDSEGNGHTNNSPSYDHQSPNPPAGKGGVDMDDDIPFSRFNENFQH